MTEILAGLVGAAVSGLLTFGATYYFQVLRRDVRRIGIELESRETIVPNLAVANPGVRVSVRKSLLYEGASDDEFEEVISVQSFRFRVKNVGRGVVRNQLLIFECEAPARLIEVHLSKAPNFGTFEPTFALGDPTSGSCTLSVPFLNPGDEMTLLVQSVDNDGNICRAHAVGAGVEQVDLARRRRLFVALVVGIIALLLSVPPGVLRLLELANELEESRVLESYTTVSLILSVPIFAFVVIIWTEWFLKLLARLIVRFSDA